ncbi:MAG: Co2+/Mg2+ efflux protein ApaG [Candidatus Hydrogenedentes bacterium]|nr:Co2+/Mg2+ efflux protein ApaG [Candidatus Hydrogenedentota bacterium]
MSEALTKGIRVATQSFYVPEQSKPADRHFFFAYRIRISNEGDEPAQLINRHWIITDRLGRAEEVRGEGVVGKQPRLEPGEHFEYTSACPLATPTGTMRGTYSMLRDDGTEFEARIPDFDLIAKVILN